MKWNIAAVLLLGSATAFAQQDTTMEGQLEEVQVVERLSKTSLSRKSVSHTELITAGELKKAACCDLSESFETNPSVSASFTDAITGTRQIKLLGLDGPYSLYSRGNIATMGGLSSVLGLGFIPGAWIQSIQLTKGPGSVVNGSGALAGQINYELRPSTTPNVGHFNLFASPGRTEQNAIYTWKQGKNLSSNIHLHGRQQLFRQNNNGDEFLDIPLSNHIFVQNVFKYNGFDKNGEHIREGQTGIKYSFIDNLAGHESYHPSGVALYWGHLLTTRKLELWTKNGFFLKKGINRSLGTQFLASYQDLLAGFGMAGFAGTEHRQYANVIFQDNIVDTRHTLKIGGTVDHLAIAQQAFGYNLSYREILVGGYGEYNFSNDQWSSIIGLRLDHSLIHGWQPVPRWHLKWSKEKFTWRGLVGRAYRTPTIGAEYMGLMANNRTPLIHWANGTYAAAPLEAAWTVGNSVSWTPKVNYKTLNLSLDLFQTVFTDKVIVDLDQDWSELHFYHYSAGKLSEAASSLALQFQGDYEFLHRTRFKWAYRYLNVQVPSIELVGSDGAVPMEEAILTVPHLVYGGISYSGRKKLNVELNVTYNSAQRLPREGYEPYSEPFAMVSGQVAKEFRKFGEIYLGVQNALNYKQNNPIIGNGTTPGERFDASVIWGPIMGRQFYLGWRYDLRKKKI